MNMHIEGRDFDVIMESYCAGEQDHRILGRRGAGIRPGDVLVTLYRGRLEPWTVRDIVRNEGEIFSAHVVTAREPEPDHGNVIAFPARRMIRPGATTAGAALVLGGAR